MKGDLRGGEVRGDERKEKRGGECAIKHAPTTRKWRMHEYTFVDREKCNSCKKKKSSRVFFFAVSPVNDEKKPTKKNPSCVIFFAVKLCTFFLAGSSVHH